VVKQRFAPVSEPRLAADLTALDIADLESEDAFEAMAITGDLLSVEADYVEFTASKLSGVALSGATLDNSSLVDVLVLHSELSGVSLTNASLTRVEFRECRLTGLAASGVKARDVTFMNCKLDSANFHMSQWERCRFVDCELNGAEFTASTLTSVRFVDSRLSRTEFAEASLSDVAFHGSTLDVIGGAAGMRGAIVGSDQVASLATSVFAALGIEINDEI
jgi:uncharacterized protein YjbI with pentapeptide repeats